jgi:23S rRNA pseudouridine2605 synthase
VPARQATILFSPNLPIRAKPAFPLSYTSTTEPLNLPMLERLQKIIARAGIASRRHAEELIKSGLVTVNGQTITELGSKADESKDHIKVQGKLLRPETERVYLLLNKPPEVVSTMVDPEGRRSLTDLLHGVSQRVFPVGRLEYHSLGLVFLTNDGELANLMLKAHHLPQSYNLKLKTLLTFEEIESLAQSTGARITRIKGKDAPWYEVTLSEARRDQLRNRLFQTGHPVEKIKRVKIGNLALEDLSVGTYRPLSDAEVNTLRRMVQPGATQSSPTAHPAILNRTQPGFAATAAPAAAGSPTPGFSLAIPRRPLVKRRPYQPKPKPGEAKRPTQSLVPRDNTPRPHQNFQDAPQDRTAPPPTRPAPFSAPPQKSFQNSRPGHPARPDFKSRPAAAGGRPSKPSFTKSHGSKSHDEKPRGPWKLRPPFRREGPGGSKPHHGAKPFQKFRSDSFQRSEQDSDYDRPIKPKSEAPWRRSELSQPSGRPSGGPGAKFRSGSGGAGGSRKPGAPWKSRKPSEPGAFGRAKSKFTKPGGRSAGMKPRPGGPKRGGSGPGHHRPKPGNFTGPKGRR